ncbi:hypothetical protein EDM56_09105 [Brevibacillus fluminis]|uniref:Uncharacterized protein n=2 Tax=Brevibacillus fluminis TaxID=511487 RepID=A0A3M8DR76_9BACL|nr:hypothetical protein EDM56_09105 [Brevibacillus fluminis]
MKMSRRNLLSVLITSGIVAAIGYMLMPKRRNGFSLNINRLPLSRKNMMKAGAMLFRSLRTAVAR